MDAIQLRRLLGIPDDATDEQVEERRKMLVEALGIKLDLESPAPAAPADHDYIQKLVDEILNREAHRLGERTDSAGTEDDKFVALTEQYFKNPPKAADGTTPTLSYTDAAMLASQKLAEEYEAYRNANTPRGIRGKK